LNFFHDLRDIEEVLHAYAFHLDGGERDQVIALFTEDCFIDYGIGYAPPVHGLANYKKMMYRTPLHDLVATSHHISNVHIELEPGAGEAVTRCNLFAYHRFTARADALMWGQYHDKLVRLDGRWLIKERRLLSAGEQGFGPDHTRVPRVGSPWAPA
jgi:3-phenylpropionate/cinnamic acid dioxygenase small subunit